MTIDRQVLDAMDRAGLLAEASRNGVKRPEVMTRVELTDEILRVGTPNPVERKVVRGWLGVARDLVASIVDKGLNLPDAAAVIRGDVRFEPLKQHPHAPVATVTLAEIYGAQGHYARAIQMLDEVLDKEPDHHVARRLRDRLVMVDGGRRGVAGVAPVASAPVALVAALPPLPSEESEPASSDSFDDDLAEDSDGTAMTLPPRGGYASHVNGSSSAPLVDDDGTLPTLPPLAGDDGDTLPTLPPLADVALPRAVTSEDADGTAETLPVASGDEVDEAPRTLAPEQLQVAEEPPRLAQQENPVRRVAPSDVDWEPLPQTELAPSIVGESPAAGAAEHSGGGTDALIVLRTGDTTASLYFELGTAPSHAAVLRVVELRPRRTFAERIERELPVTSKGGLVMIEDLEQGSIVRAAIGVREGDLFRALAVAAEVRASEAGPQVVWAPRKQGDYGSVAQNAALVLPQLRA